MPFGPKNKAAVKHPSLVKGKVRGFAQTQSQERLIPIAAKRVDLSAADWIRNAVDQALDDQGFELDGRDV